MSNYHLDSSPVTYHESNPKPMYREMQNHMGSNSFPNWHNDFPDLVSTSPSPNASFNHRIPLTDHGGVGTNNLPTYLSEFDKRKNNKARESNSDRYFRFLEKEVKHSREAYKGENQVGAGFVKTREKQKSTQIEQDDPNKCSRGYHNRKKVKSEGNLDFQEDIDFANFRAFHKLQRDNQNVQEQGNDHDFSDWYDNVSSEVKHPNNTHYTDQNDRHRDNTNFVHVPVSEFDLFGLKRFSGDSKHYADFKETFLALTDNFPDKVALIILKQYLDNRNLNAIKYINTSCVNAKIETWRELDKKQGHNSTRGRHHVVQLIAIWQWEVKNNLEHLQDVHSYLKFHLAKASSFGIEYEIHAEIVCYGLATILFGYSREQINILMMNEEDKNRKLFKCINIIGEHIDLEYQNKKSKEFHNMFNQKSYVCKKGESNIKFQNIQKSDSKVDMKNIESRRVNTLISSMTLEQERGRLQTREREFRSNSRERGFRSHSPGPATKRHRCIFCKNDGHWSFDCIDVDSTRALEITRNLSLCSICFLRGHTPVECITPYCQKQSCITLEKHALLICAALNSEKSFQSPKMTSMKNRVEVNRLETAIFCVLHANSSERIFLRALLDSGSSHSFIISRQVQNLHLKSFKQLNLQLSTFGSKAEHKKCSVVQVNISDNFKASKALDCNLIVVDKISDPLSSYKILQEQADFIKDKKIVLSDPEVVNDGLLEIDILIGQDYYNTIISGDRMSLPGGLVVKTTLFQTKILCGRSYILNDEGKPDPISDCNPILSVITVPFDTLTRDEEIRTLDRFSALDALCITPVNNEISPILEKFNRETIHNGERYVVKLPWISDKRAKLGTNFSQAFSRLVSSMKRKRKVKFSEECEKYEEIMVEQLEKGILEKVETIGSINEVYEKIATNPNYFDKLAVTSQDSTVHYLPHHGVYKAGSKKLRIVYDASASINKHAYSLNDCLETGPNLMNSLVHILLRFRKHEFAAKADIAKAFLQVEIDGNDKDALRLLWVENNEVWVYRFARLPFGLCCSPTILAAILKKHLETSNLNDELTQAILAAFYVDDQVTSTSSLEKLLDWREKAVKVFWGAGMNLRQWNSNSEEARNKFQNFEPEVLPLEETVLGLRWDLVTDMLTINEERVCQLLGKLPKTKRNLWSFVSKLYDPIGFLAPFTLIAKLLTRNASEICKGWDSKLPSTIAEKITNWMEDFNFLPEIQIPRNIGLINGKPKMLVGFADASGKAFAACIYLVTESKTEVISNFVMAKTRLAPSPPQSIPRLELLGAELLVNLMSSVRADWPEMHDDQIHLFTDSADVIFWIHSGSLSWPVFVANRLSAVLKNSSIKMWKHIDTTENPADIPSRGMLLSELKDSKLWWHGPFFLTTDINGGKSKLKGYDKIVKQQMPQGCLNEQVRVVHTNLSVAQVLQNTTNIPKKIEIGEIIDIDRHNSHLKLITVTVLVFKFINKLLTRINRKLENLPNKESIIHSAEILWIQNTQAEHFQELFHLTENKKTQVSSQSRTQFCDHKIYLDKEMGVLRCHTRLQSSSHAFETVNPILLPSKSCFTTLLIRHAHESLGHSGVPQTLAHLRSEYWILRGRSAVQKILRKCTKCLKVSGPFFKSPAFPPLPDFRVKRARAYVSVGLDFTGPFLVTHSETNEKFKVYMLIFTCAATRAVHLEATQSMKVNDFLMAMQRFMSLWGVPETVQSDNAKTFIRTNLEFKSIFNSRRASNFFQQNRIKWNFYTDKAPWKGGFIERLNALFKNIVKKMFRKTVLSFEEFRTILSYCSGIINSRPLTYVYSDISPEGVPLTPSMLVLGFNVNEPPYLCLRREADTDEMKFGERFKILEKIKDSFWTAWHKEYLTELFEKHSKSGKEPKDFCVPKIGEIVLIMKENSPRRNWNLGRILGVRISPRDGKIREVSLQTVSPGLKPSFIKRPPNYLVPLEIQQEYYENNPKLSITKIPKLKPKRVKFRTDCQVV